MQWDMDWMDAFKKRGALWFHDGNPRRPHALLTSGMHSGGFFNAGQVAESPHLLNKAAYALVQKLRAKYGLLTDTIQRAVGPEMGAITLAHDVARHTNPHCLTSHASKAGEGDKKRFEFKRTSPRRHERVLLVEDVLTSGTSVRLLAAAVEDCGAEVGKYVCTLVNRSDQEVVDGRTVVSLIHRPTPSWSSTECPLCTQGSIALRPKEFDNWERLNATY